MKMFRRIAYVTVVALSVSFLASCANDEVARNRNTDKPARYAMTLPQIKDAAKKGDADAQYALGFMYYYGKKVERDMTLAKLWIGKAAKQGQSRAITAMKLLGDTPSKSTKHLAKKTTTKPAAKPTTTVAAMKSAPKFAEQSKTTAKLKKVASTNVKPTATAKATPKVAKATVTTTTTTKAPTKIASTSTGSTIKGKSTSSTRIAHSTAGTPKIITDKQVQAFEKWLMTKQDDHFTLQLLGSRNLEQVEKVIEQNHLANKSAIYHTMYKSKPWYVLVYGDYKTPDDALAAIDRLPPMAQQLKPWVKPFASVKVGIRMAGKKHTA